jgi:hypothetical protein
LLRAAARATNVFYKLDGFRWARGAAQVTEYMVPDARFRTVALCSRCGGKVPWLDVTVGAAAVPRHAAGVANASAAPRFSAR